MSYLIIGILTVFVALAACDVDLDPYKTLGLNRRASANEIKRAYKRLAKEWFV